MSYEPRLVCRLEQKLQPHVFIGVALVQGPLNGWKQIWKCQACGAMRVWGMANMSDEPHPPVVHFAGSTTRLVDADMRDMIITRKSLGLPPLRAGLETGEVE